MGLKLRMDADKSQKLDTEYLKLMNNAEDINKSYQVVLFMCLLDDAADLIDGFYK